MLDSIRNSRINLNSTEKEFLVGQFRDMLDQAQTVRMVEIANLDNVQIDAYLTKPEWPTDFPVIKRRQILITVDEIVENIKL
jgi:hypothetical protein